MARFSDEEINKIKTTVSIVRLVESQGHPLTKEGKDYVCHCPFHDDKTPSLKITPATNLWHCFGCDSGGSVIDWVMKSHGISFRHAVEVLRQDVAVVNEIKSKAPQKSTIPKLASPLAADLTDQQALRVVVDYYHETLKQSPEALAYLTARGLVHPELLEHFKLGYANRTLGYRLPQKNRQQGAELRCQLQRLGLYRDSGHEHFSGSLVIPVITAQGEIADVYGRKLLDTLRKGTPKHLYLSGPHRGVFNEAALRIDAVEEVILCESLIDALTFWCHGFRHVTTSYGTGGFTEAILACFIAGKIKRVLIAYDRDEAGDSAAVKVAQLLIEHGIDAYRILFPKGMDANEYALKMQPPTKALGLVIRKAEWLGTGKAPVRGLVLVPKDDADKAAKEKNRDNAGTPDNPGHGSDYSPVDVAPSLAAMADLAATPLPRPPAEIDAVITDHEICLTLGHRLYRVRGLDKNAADDQLKINLMVKSDDKFHMDKLDLYSSKQRTVFINQAALELGVKDDVIKSDLGKVLLSLEGCQDQRRQARNAPDDKHRILDRAEQQAALALLKDNNLLQRILDDFTAAGVVGEETNKLVGYLAGVSRKLDKPLAVLIQSSSAAGKSSLMEAILAMMPEEERVQYSAMTGQSLFYMGETNLKHKILAIAEEEGASPASYALKLLQSEGEVTIASTGKDATTGNLVTHEYRVEGPVMLFLTTTAMDIDEELKNRCIVLEVNEGRDQTQAIHEQQRFDETLDGLFAQAAKQDMITLHRNAQRLLKPLKVVNPYAKHLTFLNDKTRMRRDHKKYLTLIRTITFLHQYQREIKTTEKNGHILEYVEVTLDDIAVANRLAHEVLGKTLDEVPPQTRNLLSIIHTAVTAACQQHAIERCHYRFSRKRIRQWCGWSYTQVRVHLDRLVEMEYLLTHRGGRGQSFEYELLYEGEGQDGNAFLMGLMDIEQLTASTMTRSSRGQTPLLTAPTRAQNGGFAVSEKVRQASDDAGCSEAVLDSSEKVDIPLKKSRASYPQNEETEEVSVTSIEESIEV